VDPDSDPDPQHCFLVTTLASFLTNNLATFTWHQYKRNH
jgi:hypothetical protein